jgi:hypothetical protein
LFLIDLPEVSRAIITVHLSRTVKRYSLAPGRFNKVPAISPKLDDAAKSTYAAQHTPFELPTAAQVAMASGDDQYHPKDAVKAAVNASMVTGAAGAFVSAIQNTLTKRNVGAWGIFTRTGSTIAVFSMSPWDLKCSFGLSLMIL